MLPNALAACRNWGQMLSEITVLMTRRFKSRAPIPDLTCKCRGVPASDVIAVRGHWKPARSRPAGAKQFVVGRSHTQGLEC